MGEQDNVLHHHGFWFVAVVSGLALKFIAAQHHTTSSHFLLMNVWLCLTFCVIYNELAVDPGLAEYFSMGMFLVLFSLSSVVTVVFFADLDHRCSHTGPCNCKVTCS